MNHSRLFTRIGVNSLLRKLPGFAGRKSPKITYQKRPELLILTRETSPSTFYRLPPLRYPKGKKQPKGWNTIAKQQRAAFERTWNEQKGLT